MASPTPPHYHHLISPKPHHQNPPPPLHHSTHTHTHTRPHHHRLHATPTPLTPTTPTLTPDFRRTRTTKPISKRNPGNSPASSLPSSSPAAAVFLSHFLSSSSSPEQCQLSSLSAPEDHCSILRSLRSPSKVLSFFSSSLPLMSSPAHKGKLLVSAISSLGRSSRPDLARSLFDSSLPFGFADTVFAHSALISAYARNSLPHLALSVFSLLRSKPHLPPSLVSFNSAIDACAKAHLLPTALSLFRDMLAAGLQPDSKTFNSLLAACARAGCLDPARSLFFDEMPRFGVPRDIYTYNTFLDAACRAGDMDLALRVVSGMLAEDVRPNVVTFSTLVDGYSKLERFDEALNLYAEMQALGIRLDRVCYNALLTLYVRTGQYEELPRVCEEMDVVGVDKDTVTYNSLISGYGKQGRLDVIRFLVQDMRARGITSSVLTYSTLIDVYSKAGMYGDAAKAFLEFKDSGLKADVVLYSSFVDTLAKNGLVDCAVWLLDEMVRVGIEPNVVTYNTVIDGFGKSSTFADDGESSTALVQTGKEIAGPPPAAEEARRRSEELVCILGLFRRMIRQGVRPNVVTFSAILNACSRCNSFQDASLLLDQLRSFDNFTYGVAHGMLMGCREAWTQAQCLFDELRRMDPSTSSAFYNALTDMLWHFGQKRGAQQVALEGVHRQVWENAWSEFNLDLHLMSSGAAQAMVHAWLLNVHSIVIQGRELPSFFSILTGWGKHSKVAGASTIRRVVEALLKSIGAPFQIEKFNVGRLVSPGVDVASWLRESDTISILLLRDERNQLASPPSLLPQLQALQL